MAKISGSEIRPGYVIEHDGGLWVAVKTNTVKPGKGGAYNQVELKNLINGTKLNERFRSAETVEQIRLDLKDFSFLYEQGDALVFMDTESYEQLELAKDFVGERAAFLQDGMMVTVQLYEERPIGISLPDQVTLTITEADPVVRGQTAASSYKPAVLGVLALDRAALFHQEGITRPRLRKLGENDLFGLAIGLADIVARSLHRDLQVLHLAEVARQRAAGLHRGLDHDVEESGTRHFFFLLSAG